jgi:predicted DsbA family dithiol-disulfide isomerase
LLAGNRQLQPGEHIYIAALFRSRLLKANFTDSLNVSDRAVLISTAASAGLDAAQAREVLESMSLLNWPDPQ